MENKESVFYELNSKTERLLETYRKIVYTNAKPQKTKHDFLLEAITKLSTLEKVQIMNSYYSAWYELDYTNDSELLDSICNYGEFHKINYINNDCNISEYLSFADTEDTAETFAGYDKTKKYYVFDETHYKIICFNTFAEYERQYKKIVGYGFTWNNVIELYIEKQNEMVLNKATANKLMQAENDFYKYYSDFCKKHKLEREEKQKELFNKLDFNRLKEALETIENATIIMNN